MKIRYIFCCFINIQLTDYQIIITIMKRLNFYLIMLTSIFMLASCTAGKKMVDNRSVKEKIESQRYTFKADYVSPTSAGFQPRYLTSEYTLKVTPDTVQAYLPYFGRAYEAPFNPSDGGFKFTSTNFNYELKQGKKPGNWIINIKIHDQRQRVEFNFEVWDNGKGDLRVFDQSKQPISFQGELE